MDDYGIRHPLLVVDDKLIDDGEHWRPNDNIAKRHVRDRTGRARHDPTRSAARSRHTGGRLETSESSISRLPFTDNITSDQATKGLAGLAGSLVASNSRFGAHVQISGWEFGWGSFFSNWYS